jgi:P-type Ca2+ transporter type 2C
MVANVNRRGGPAGSTAPGETVPAWHALSTPDVVRAQEVDPERGLDEVEVSRRRDRFGPNRFAEARPEPRWRALVRQYKDLMQIVLFATAVASFWPLKEYGTGIFLLLITAFNAVLGMHQEGKAAAAVAALSKMMIVKAKVRRSGSLGELPAEDLVPGDVVHIEAGDVVPADGRIVSEASLEIDESALTGESVPVPKATDAVDRADVALGDRVNMAYMNTHVTRGSAAFVVTATGMDTEVGHISGMLQGAEPLKTPLTHQLDTLTSQMLQRPDLPCVDRNLDRRDLPEHHLLPVPAVPRHDATEPSSMVDLQRGRSGGRARHRDPEARPAEAVPEHRCRRKGLIPPT